VSQQTSAAPVPAWPALVSIAGPQGHLLIPYGEDPVRVIDHALTVLEVLCESPPQTFEAKVERGSRYDGQTGIPEYMQ
jgi:hypothetical protein